MSGSGPSENHLAFKRVVVVGAGTAGQSMTRALLRAGLEYDADFVIVDAADPENVLTERTERLPVEPHWRTTVQGVGQDTHGHGLEIMTSIGTFHTRNVIAATGARTRVVGTTSTDHSHGYDWLPAHVALERTVVHRRGATAVPGLFVLGAPSKGGSRFPSVAQLDRAARRIARLVSRRP